VTPALSTTDLDQQIQARMNRTDQGERHTTFREYTERWRRTRQITRALDYQRHLESRLFNHHYPHFGDQAIRSMTVTDILEWISKLLENKVAQSSVSTYFAVLNVIMNAAVVDRAIVNNPCRCIRITAMLRGLSRAPKWAPTTEDVLALIDVVPNQYLAAVWLAAGEGMRLGEVLGIEDGPRCVDVATRVVQQLRFHKTAYGGFYLAPPKAGSVGDIDLDDQVALALADHVQNHPPVSVLLPDITRGTPDPGKAARRRSVPLLFTDEFGRPIHDQAFRRCGEAGGRPPGGRRRAP
jgi:integrase